MTTTERPPETLESAVERQPGFTSALEYLDGLYSAALRMTSPPASSTPDWQLARAESHTSTGLRSAEAEALDRLPDADVKAALQALSARTPTGTVLVRPHRGRGRPRSLPGQYATAAR